MMEDEKNGIRNDVFSGKQMLVILGVLFILALGIWGFNSYRLKQVTIEGLTRYSEEEFKEKLKEGFWYSITPLFCMADTLAQKEIPFIEKYEIEYVDRQTARILVHEKRITGCVIVMGRYMFFDKDGIIVETAATRIDGIPVITGLEYNEIVLYQKLQVQKQSLFDTILNLTKLIEQNNLEVQEISFDSGYEVTLYIGDITVWLGKRTSYDEALNALDGILSAVGDRTGTLDMRNYSRENTEVILK